MAAILPIGSTVTMTKSSSGPIEGTVTDVIYVIQRKVPTASFHSANYNVLGRTHELAASSQAAIDQVNEITHRQVYAFLINPGTGGSRRKSRRRSRRS